jgi:hypothetical protein
MRTDTSQTWISKTLEASFNTPEPTGTNYVYIPTDEAYFLLPKMEKVNDAARIGRNAPSHLCNTYWSPTQLALKGDVETDVPARLFARGLGGSITNTVVETSVAWDHTFPILSPQVGSILPFFSIASLLGAASYMFAGCMVERFKMSQKNAERAMFEADVVGSGKFTNPHGLSSLPPLATTPCMDGFRTGVTYVDDVAATIDLGTAGTIIEWMVEHKNNIQSSKRRVGDTIQTVGTAGSGAHVKKMPRGKYETNISMVVDFVDLTDWTAAVQNTVYTNLKFKAVGPLIGASVTNRHEFEIIVPSFIFDSVDTSDDNGDAATPINIIALQDSVSAGTITGRVRNGVATLL